MSYCQIYQTNSNPEARVFVLLTTTVIRSKNNGISTTTTDKAFCACFVHEKDLYAVQKIALDLVSL